MTTAPAAAENRWLSKGVVAVGALVVILAAILVGIFVKGLFGGGSSNEMTTRSISDLRAQIRQNPDDPALRVQLADAYINKQDWQNALTQSQEALKIDENYLGAFVDQGLAYRGLAQYQGAVNSLQQVVDRTKDNPNLANDPRLQAVEYFLADSYLSLGDGQNALAHGQAAWKINRTDADTIFLIGKAEVLLGDYATAINAFETALAFDPEYADVYPALQDAANRLPDQQKAEAAAATYSILTGDNAGGVQKLEQLTAADWTDKKALSRALWALAKGYENLGRRDDARATAQKAVDADADNLAAQDALGKLKQ